MIKDNIQPQSLGGYKLPKLKGTVEIKLHNPTTGKTEIHKGENMITNAVSDIFASNYCGALDYRKLLPLYNKMYGGILCFSKELNVTGTQELPATKDYFIPDGDPTNGNPLTAHAGQTALQDQTDDYTRGSPSRGNMSVEDGKVTLAWEWGISGGNGTISALALTHTDVGDAGTGSTSQAFQAFKPIINAAYNDVGGSYGLSTSATPQIRFIKDGYAYAFWNDDTTSLVITKIPIAFQTTGLVASNPFIDMDSSLTESHTVDISALNLYSNRHPFYFFDGSNTLWLLSATGQQRTVAYMTVNLTTWATTSGTVTTDDSSVTVGHLDSDTNNGSIGTCEVLFDGTYMYLPRGWVVRYANTISGFLKMRLPPNDNDQTTTGLTASCKGAGGFYIPNTSHRVLVADSLVVNNGVSYPCSSDSNWDYYSSISAMPFVIKNNGLTSLCLQRVTSTGYYYVGVSKFYLGTKYNLTTPVVKSASQSMIITYTLEEVSSND